MQQAREHASQERFAEAQDALKKALEIDPSNDEARAVAEEAEAGLTQHEVSRLLAEANPTEARRV